MVSELVTNAFRHGTGRSSCTVESDADGMWAEVHDEGSGTIATPEPALSAAAGGCTSWIAWRTRGASRTTRACGSASAASPPPPDQAWG